MAVERYGPEVDHPCTVLPPLARDRNAAPLDLRRYPVSSQKEVEVARFADVVRMGMKEKLAMRAPVPHVIFREMHIGAFALSTDQCLYNGCVARSQPSL